MNETTGWVDDRYQQVFEDELRGLERRRANDPACTVEQIQGLLKHLYIFAGQDWDGRGKVFETTIAATLAAHEFFIAEWKKELSRSSQQDPQGSERP